LLPVVPPTPALATSPLHDALPICIFLVGRNYHAHALEMGAPVDKSSARPMYFTKSSSALVESGATVPYPPATADYHYEMELVVADRKSTRLNSSHVKISYAVFCLK